MHGRTLFAPTTRLKPPLCKGRWHGGAVTEGLERVWACWVISVRSQSPTAYRRSPSGPGPSVAARHLPTLWGVTLYTRGPHSAPAILATVGASIARPQNLTLPPNSPGEHCSPLRPPYPWGVGRGLASSLPPCHYYGLILRPPNSKLLSPALFRGGFCVFSQILQKTKG